MSGQYVTILVLKDATPIDLEAVKKAIYEHDVWAHDGGPQECSFDEWKTLTRLTQEQQGHIVVLGEFKGWGCCNEVGEKFIRKNAKVTHVIYVEEGDYNIEEA